jgi:hypothetical protein
MNPLKWMSSKTKPQCPFPEKELRKWYLDSKMPPEVYAAKNTHKIDCFSLDEFSYKDKELEAWICRFAEIFTNPDEVEKCRIKHLTDEEYREVIEYIEDIIAGRTIP